MLRLPLGGWPVRREDCEEENQVSVRVKLAAVFMAALEQLACSPESARCFHLSVIRRALLAGEATACPSPLVYQTNVWYRSRRGEELMGRTPAGQTRERIYRFMRERLLGGRSPTVREVQERFGFKAVQSAREHLERLVEEGRLDKQAGQARGYRLPGRNVVMAMVPVLGRVPAGPVDLAVEDLSGYVPIESRQGARESDELFALRIHGESMRDLGILDGDLAIVRKQATARNGDVVVALIGEEATVKTFRRIKRRVVLEPANSAYQPIVPDPSELLLLGVVIEIRRSM